LKRISAAGAVDPVCACAVAEWRHPPGSHSARAGPSENIGAADRGRTSRNSAIINRAGECGVWVNVHTPSAVPVTRPGNNHSTSPAAGIDARVRQEDSAPEEGRGRDMARNGSDRDAGVMPMKISSGSQESAADPELPETKPDQRRHIASHQENVDRQIGDRKITLTRTRSGRRIDFRGNARRTGRTIAAAFQ